MGRRLFSVVCSFVASVLCVYFLLFNSEAWPAWAKLGALAAAAFAAGTIQGKLIGGEYVKTAVLGAFLGVLLLWTPVVLVTYGFALLALPLLIAYAAIVGAGVRCSTRLFAA